MDPIEESQDSSTVQKAIDWMIDNKLVMEAILKTIKPWKSFLNGYIIIMIISVGERMSIIVLDPGHSDYTHQFQAIEKGSSKKDWSCCKNMLEKQGHKVLLTRTKPVEDPSLKSRSCLVNNNAKIFA